MHAARACGWMPQAWQGAMPTTALPRRRPGWPRQAATQPHAGPLPTHGVSIFPLELAFTGTCDCDSSSRRPAVFSALIHLADSLPTDDRRGRFSLSPQIAGGRWKGACRREAGYAANMPCAAHGSASRQANARPWLVSSGRATSRRSFYDAGKYVGRDSGCRD